MVTALLIDRWLQVHADMIGDAAYAAIFRHYHRDHGECRPDLTGVDPDRQGQHMADTCTASWYGIWKSQLSSC